MGLTFDNSAKKLAERYNNSGVLDKCATMGRSRIKTPLCLSEEQIKLGVYFLSGMPEDYLMRAEYDEDRQITEIHTLGTKTRNSTTRFTLPPGIANYLRPNPMQDPCSNNPCHLNRALFTDVPVNKTEHIFHACAVFYRCNRREGIYSILSDNNIYNAGFLWFCVYCSLSKSKNNGGGLHAYEHRLIDTVKKIGASTSIPAADKPTEWVVRAAKQYIKDGTFILSMVGPDPIPGTIKDYINEALPLVTDKSTECWKLLYGKMREVGEANSEDVMKAIGHAKTRAATCLTIWGKNIYAFSIIIKEVCAHNNIVLGDVLDADECKALENSSAYWAVDDPPPEILKGLRIELHSKSWLSI
jgi:hypothetical protein